MLLFDICVEYSHYITQSPSHKHLVLLLL